MKVKNIPSGPLMVNTYLVWDDTNKGFIVDPGGFNKKIEDSIAAENIDLEYIILTHGHCDHIGGVNAIKEKYGCKVVAAKAELPMLQDHNINMSRELLGAQVEFTPDILVDENDTMKIGNMLLHFIMTPGHSEGGMCIRIGRVLFSGDTLFHGSVGRTDFVGGSMEVLVNSIKEKLFVLPDDTKVFPGHMGSTTIGFEKENNPFV